MNVEATNNVSIECVASVLQELNALGIWHAIDGSECWDLETIVGAVEYQRSTGRNPVQERHLITLAEYRQGYDANYIVCNDGMREAANNVLSGGFWKVDDKTIEVIKSMLREADIRESYEFRRKEADLHIAKASVRKRIFQRDGKRCLNCGNTEKLSLDHIVAVVNGGGNDDENLQTLCSSCNSSKGAKACWPLEGSDGG